MSDKRDDLQLAEELFQFLQGKLPEGVIARRKEIPKLSADQAWTVIWYWHELAIGLETEFSEMDVPKFRHLLHRIRLLTIHAKMGTGIPTT